MWEKGSDGRPRPKITGHKKGIMGATRTTEDSGKMGTFSKTKKDDAGNKEKTPDPIKGVEQGISRRKKKGSTPWDMGA